MAGRPRKQVKQGSLKLSLTEARNLPEKKKGDGFLNPFCILGPVDAAGNFYQDKVIKTPVLKRTLRPNWNTTFNFPISPEFCGINLEIWDEDKRNNFLGQVSFPPEILLDGRDLSTWFSLSAKPGEKRKEVVKGDIYVSLLYMSDELRKELDPEGWAAEQAALQVQAQAQAQAQAQSQAQLQATQGTSGGSHIADKPKREKKKDQIEELLRDARAQKVDAAQQLLTYIIVSSNYSNIESLDVDYVKIAIEKGVVDALMQGMRAPTVAENADFRAYGSEFFGRLGELDKETTEMLVERGAVRLSLESAMGLTGENTEQFKHAVVIFNVAKHPAVKKLCMELKVIPRLFEILKKSKTAEMVALCCKPLNQLLAESDSTEPSKKEIASAIVDCGGLTEAMNGLHDFSDKEDVMEQWLPLIDICLDCSPKFETVGTKGLDTLLTIMQKHRFVIQVSGASIVSRMAESDEFAKHINTCGGIPVLVKVLGTESNLSKYEQRSREVVLKCLNRCLAHDDGDPIQQLKQAGLPKILEAAMRGYGTFFIIQIQSILLIKAVAKDEEMRQMLKDVGVGSLLTAAANKHSVTRLHKIVKELKETYNW